MQSGGKRGKSLWRLQRQSHGFVYWRSIFLFDLLAGEKMVNDTVCVVCLLVWCFLSDFTLPVLPRATNHRKFSN